MNSPSVIVEYPNKGVRVIEVYFVTGNQFIVQKQEHMFAFGVFDVWITIKKFESKTDAINFLTAEYV